MKKYILFLLVILLNQTAYGNLQINEIMYNPINSDKDKEYIELYHFPWQNLTDYIIEDQKSNNTLFVIQINKSSNYSLIIENDTILDFPNVSLYTTGNIITYQGLNNNDIIILKNSTNQTHCNYTINSSLANNNGKSIEQHNGSWYESIAINGTPGKRNSITKYLNQEFFSYNASLINNTLTITTNCSKKISFYFFNISRTNSTSFNTSCNKTIYINLTEFNISIYTKNHSIQLAIPIPDNNNCNISLSIKTNKDIYHITEKIEFYNIISDPNHYYSISYWIEDPFGTIVKDPYTTKNTNKKSFQPKFSETDKLYIIKNKIINISCNNTNKNSSSQKIIPVIGIQKNIIKLESILKIIQVHLGKDNKAKFGEVIRLELLARKSNTTKTQIKVYIEGPSNKKLSQTSSFNIYTNDINNSITLPIQIFPNCDDSIQNGFYKITVEGLGIISTKTIEIENKTTSLCKTITKSADCPKCTHASIKSNSSQISSKKKISFFLVNPKNKTSKKNITTEINITNPESISYNLSIYSYIYKNSISYSGIRESNIINFSIPAFSNLLIPLHNNIYTNNSILLKVKTKIYTNNKKTPSELTYDLEYIHNISNNLSTKPITIPTYSYNSKTTSKKNSSFLPKTIQKDYLSKNKSNTFYSSPSEKSKRFSSPVFISILLILTISAVLRYI